MRFWILSTCFLLQIVLVHTQLFSLISKLLPPPPGQPAAFNFAPQHDAPVRRAPTSRKKNPFDDIFALLSRPLNPPRSPAPKTPQKPKQTFQSDSPRSSLIPLEEEPLLKIFPKKPKVHRDSGGGSDNPLSLLSGAFPKSSSPLLRITDNFGKNFFPMLDELHEYTGPDAKTALTGVSGLTQPGAQADDAVQNSPADFLSAHNLMTAWMKATSRTPEKPMKPMTVIYDGTEAGRNRPLMGQLFEADILLTSKQMKAIVLAEAERTAGGKRRSKRKVITGLSYRWPANRPIPFVFGHYDKEWRQLIKGGLILWEKETCLRFKENGPGKDKIEFFKGSGCYSSVGKVGGKQKVSIGVGCEDEGIVSHEVGHALGFWHEQSRPDRDEYIKLNDDYIAGGTEGNFAKRSDLETDGMGLPYDLGSVMHYGPQAFTTDYDKITIKTRDNKYQHTIGQRTGPSFIDVKQINRLYCNEVCKAPTIKCAHLGYPDPNDCSKCKCPPGFGGRQCIKVEATPCGGELTALAGTWQHLTHIGKDRCVWRIKSSRGRIRFILDGVSYQCDSTCKSFAEVKHNSDFQQIGFRSCCDEKNVEVLSDQNEVLVIHDSLRLNTNKGGSFSLRYIEDSGLPVPKPPLPVWVPGKENRAFRGVQGKNGVIERFILNALPHVRDPNKPVETTFSIFTDYLASSLLGASAKK